jgi:hypothetical protein
MVFAAGIFGKNVKQKNADASAKKPQEASTPAVRPTKNQKKPQSNLIIPIPIRVTLKLRKIREGKKNKFAEKSHATSEERRSKT